MGKEWQDPPRPGCHLQKVKHLPGVAGTREGSHKPPQRQESFGHRCSVTSRGPLGPSRLASPQREAGTGGGGWHSVVRPRHGCLHEPMGKALRRED